MNYKHNKYINSALIGAKRIKLIVSCILAIMNHVNIDAIDKEMQTLCTDTL